MAVANSLAKTKRNEANRVMSYEVAGAKVELTPEVVRNYLVSGNKERVTTQEIVMFMNLCKYSGLNPWLKEAYCIKYGNDPATMVVGKEAFMKKAESHPNYNGYQAGIIVCDPETGEVTKRPGSFRLKGEEVVGGYAEVWRKDREHSFLVEVSFDEYVGRKKDGTINSQWAKKPATMIRKVALVQALREAFPATFGGMYAAEESGFIETEGRGSIVAQDDTVLIEQQEELPDPQSMYREAEVVETEQVAQALSSAEAQQQSFF